MCQHCQLNRREFAGVSGAALAAGLLAGDQPACAAGSVPAAWDPAQPLAAIGKALKVQPVLMYAIQHPVDETSYRSWGSVHTEETVAREAQRIGEELGRLRAKAEFPLEVAPLASVRSVEEARRVHESDYDAVLVYPASGSGDLLRACFAARPEKDTLIFARHRRGPLYYWYEALSTRYLKTGAEPDPARTGAANHGPVTVHDVVIDDDQELLWRLRALAGLKNFIGQRIVALGGPMGKYDDQAPKVARERYRLEILEVGYDEFTRRMAAVRADPRRVAEAEKWTDAYLALPHTTLVTKRRFVVNSFLLYGLFRQFMQEHEATAFTIQHCMGKALPISQTTPCMPLSWLNDEGLIGLCESDFVLVPAAILLRHITGKPVFMHNSTFPHQAIVTCAHCSAPRRMDGKTYAPAKILTHCESDYGAAPKVEMPLEQELTFIDPEYSRPRWLAFRGLVKANPAYDVCRSQQDVQIQGDWKRLLAEVRDSHWVAAYGDYLREIEYASRKIGMNCVRIDA
jgi:hypothetical protein